MVVTGEQPADGAGEFSLVNALLSAVVVLSSAVVLDIAEVTMPGIDVAAAAPYALNLALIGLVLKAMFGGASTPEDSSDGRYPVPEFDRPGVPYWCAECDDWVDPAEDDFPEAGLLIGGSTTKLCPDCAREMRDEIERDTEGSR